MDFLWITEGDATRFFLQTAQLDYSREIRLRNDFRSRDTWVMDLFDAWGHCLCGAASTRDIGETATWFLGGGYELLHEGISQITIGLVEHNSYSQDSYNQAVGRSIGAGYPTGDLGQLSFDAMISGRLNLTLAGVPLGGRITRLLGDFQTPSMSTIMRSVSAARRMGSRTG